MTSAVVKSKCLTHNSHRTETEVQVEVEWLVDLAAQGAAVCVPVAGLCQIEGFAVGVFA